MSNSSGTKLAQRSPDRLVVIWIDWYPYHVARFRGLASAPGMAGKVTGIELVGGVGVHAGLKFRETLPADVTVETLLPDSDWQRASQWSLALKLWRVLGRLNPKTVLVPGYYTLPALVAAIWAKAHSRQSVLMTESTAFDHQRTGWKESIKSYLIRTIFDWAVTGGAAHRRYLQQLGFPTERVLGCYDVVDNTFFETKARELRVGAPPVPALSRKYFLYVGRLSSEKNVGSLLEAWIQHRRSGGRWPLVIVGSGPEEAVLRHVAQRSGFAADVHFAGHKSFRELPAYYAHAGCFVLPSTREPWGLVVNEALASGLPVIVSNRCGCAEDLVETGANGVLFDPADTQQLERALQGIQSSTAEEHASMSSRSLQIIQRFCPENFGQEIARLHWNSGPALKTAFTPEYPIS